ncbi:S41 family peptidase [Mucilaginibacter sp. L3T2-6]|uniref:S41 family peptidase n=1 Tax=Mucilaginibacter sp. L3T2-6 TaxID=3062491 RepID=UPI00267628FF|nr:S41 family peptidase [Mucilaginibacter sp. L3T2-6]MDO3645119.1 S41 family peptidase [Mucilaginibacter sp. L3T2-6]MDV6217571.1 S41 family peptidase [Mucilaginibacter sp. L3T2-6]
MKKLITLILALTSANAIAQSYTSKQFKQDFNYFWNTIDSNYAYFAKKQINWKYLKNSYRQRADTVTSRNSFVTLLEDAIYELYDHHCSLRTNTKFSRRLVPTSADMWADYLNGKPVIREVRKGFGAEKAGVKAGMQVIAVNDVPVEEAVKPFMGHNTSNEAKSFALRLVLAGDHFTKRKITLKAGNAIKDYFPDEDGLALEDVHYNAMIESQQIGGIGYIKINNFLFDNSLIAKFDSVLNTLLKTRAMIIDLRETPSGGNTSVARAILGRFITKEHIYQKHELPGEELETGIKRSWIEIVSPRGVAYTRPLVILADHWTGSIAEGITIAFDGMKRATVIGTEMARLNGAVYSFEMPNTKIGFNITAEKLYHINGQPREFFKPAIGVDVTNQKPGPGGDVILNKAILFLKIKIR